MINTKGFRRGMVLLVFLALAACGKSGGGGGVTAQPQAELPHAPAPVSLQRVWTMDDGSASMDLSVVDATGASALTYTSADGAACACFMAVQGDATSGKMTLTDCAYSGGGRGEPGGETTNCSGGLNGEYTYQVDASGAMRLCRGLACGRFE